ncbi:slipin family protein [bacterium]|jgi:regulator of protease activity HflC (stomatin/prohibitin superfamily)|nr:slipin family protein [bacterium]
MISILISTVVLAIAVLRVLNEYERGVVFRLGRVLGARGPGLTLVIPLVDRMLKVDLRTITLDVPPQDIISRDNVTIKVNAVIYFKVVDPVRAVVEVENYLLATSKLAQTTLRSVVGQVDLDALLSQRDAINQRLQSILDSQTGPWGVKVMNVEIKQVDLPVEMQRAMAKQAEAERERRAKIIAADGEYEASLKLAEAAKNMETQPMSLQLRYLQTIREMSTERATTTILPFPIELLRYFNSKN